MRVQLALNVKDLEKAVEFYSKAFGAAPNKRRPGYANFALDHPPLKLVLLENPGATERLNHLGVEVFEESDVTDAIERLGAAGLPRDVEVDKTCCYAKQNKVWSVDPEGARWEWYRVLENSETFAASEARSEAKTSEVHQAPAAPTPGITAPAAATAAASEGRACGCAASASANP
jgi:catechol 2,3-dioxygenase-like lactoylglutathione lyase family enzyme